MRIPEPADRTRIQKMAHPAECADFLLFFFFSIFQETEQGQNGNQDTKHQPQTASETKATLDSTIGENTHADRSKIRSH